MGTVTSGASRFETRKWCIIIKSSKLSNSKLSNPKLRCQQLILISETLWRMQSELPALARGTLQDPTGPIAERKNGKSRCKRSTALLNGKEALLLKNEVGQCPVSARTPQRR